MQSSKGKNAESIHCFLIIANVRCPLQYSTGVRHRLFVADLCLCRNWCYLDSFTHFINSSQVLSWSKCHNIRRHTYNKSIYPINLDVVWKLSQNIYFFFCIFRYGLKNDSV